MLRNIHIKFFRSCSDVRIENIEELTLLVGRNGVGKSNILKAINWCAHTATSKSAIQVVDYVSAEVEFEVFIDGYSFFYNLDAGFRKLDKTHEWSLNEKLDVLVDGHRFNYFDRTGATLNVYAVEAPLIISGNTPALTAISSLIPLHPYADVIKKFSDFLVNIKYYPLIEIESAGEDFTNAFVSESQFSQWEVNKFAENSSRIVMCKILDFYLNKPEKFTELSALLNESGMGVISNISIENFEVPKHFLSNPSSIDEQNPEKTKIYFLNFQPVLGTSNRGYRFDNLSFGTKRIIRFITDFLYDNASVSLLEQPEDGIHCGLLYKLFDLLDSYSEDRQTIVASHSADILDRAGPGSIRIVDMLDGVTSLRELTKKEHTAANNFRENTGGLSDFIRSLQE